MHGLALLVAISLVAPGDTVPLQRPKQLGPDRPAAAPAEVEPAPAPVEPVPSEVEPSPALVEPAPVPAEPAPSEVEPAPSVEVTPASSNTGGRIEGLVFDREIATARIGGATVKLLCSCLDEAQFAVSGHDGRFAFESLPAGVYTILVDRGARPTKRIVSLLDKQTVEVTLVVTPPTTTEELDRRRDEAARARTEMSIGGVLGVGALALLVGAGVERAKPDCKFGLDDCSSAPRRNVAIGLGVAGALAAATGGVLIGLGVHRLRRLRASIAISDRELAFVAVTRF